VILKKKSETTKFYGREERGREREIEREMIIEEIANLRSSSSSCIFLCSRSSFSLLPWMQFCFSFFVGMERELEKKESRGDREKRDGLGLWKFCFISNFKCQWNRPSTKAKIPLVYPLI
jgi:hypothetical protein